MESTGMHQQASCSYYRPLRMRDYPKMNQQMQNLNTYVAIYIIINHLVYCQPITATAVEA